MKSLAARPRRFFLTVIFALFIISLSLLIAFEFKNRTKRLDRRETFLPEVQPTPTPTPRPLTFTEMNVLYGPCVSLPTFIYHHVQDPKEAQEKRQTSLTVDTLYFRKQMQFLKDKGYMPVKMSDLVNFFDSAVPIPKKSVLLTFDDAYEDFYFNVFPILKEFNFPATLFTPTGLVGNPGYLTWEEISQIASSGLVLFANHTWSHKNVESASDVVEREILTADTQLSEKGLNITKVFAYPYGVEGSRSIEVLSKLGYKLAFSTRSGSILCKKQRFSLPRVRVGNINLSAYGF